MQITRRWFVLGSKLVHFYLLSNLNGLHLTLCEHRKEDFVSETKFMCLANRRSLLMKLLLKNLDYLYP